MNLAAIAGLGASLNPIMAMILSGLAAAKVIKDAFVSAFPKAVMDKTTGQLYEDRAAALAAGVLEENLTLTVTDATLVATFLSNSKMFVTEVGDAEKWAQALVDAKLTPAPPV